MSEQVVHIEVTVGELPEWYDEALQLEQRIKKAWHSNINFVDANVKVSYAYNGAHAVVGYNRDGDKVFERECDLDSIFGALAPEEA
jgi:hypothetical protein